MKIDYKMCIIKYISYIYMYIINKYKGSVNYVK